MAACGSSGDTPASAPAEPALKLTPPSQGNGQVSGFVFEDTNRNGALDAGERRLQGQTVRLENAERTVTYLSVTTGPDGAYSFDKLAPAEYRVTVKIPDGFVRTSDNSFTLTVTPDGTPSVATFGIVGGK